MCWNKKWKTALVWVSGYLNFLALLLVGGFFYVKKEEEELQVAAKNAFIVTAIFTALNAFLSLFNYIGGLTNTYYGSSAYEFYSTFSTIVGIARIVVFAVFVILAFVKKETAPAATVSDQQATEND